jgi:hypothetical protein
MSQLPYDANRLQAELAQLRAALRTVEAPALDEADLRARFREAELRAAERERARDAVAGRGGGSRLLPLAAAAAVALAIGSVLTVVALRTERPVSSAATPPASAPAAVGAFQPLLSSPGLSASSSYSVVRVRIPLSAFAAVPGTVQDGTIEADLLVGEDGLARAIRFNEADAALVSVADQ